MTNLKLITARYACKCASCQRDIKLGWKVFFNPADKNVFCKPCGDKIVSKDGEQETEKPVNNTGIQLLEQLVTAVSLQGDLMAKMDSDIRDIQKDVVALDVLIRSMRETKPKATKKS